MSMKIYRQALPKRMTASPRLVRNRSNTGDNAKSQHETLSLSAPIFTMTRSLSKMVRIGFGMSLLAFFAPLAFAQSVAPPEIVIDWERKLDAHAGLTALGTGLLGDSIDPHTGTISFQTTDVSLPGNSKLEVAVSRRLTTGRLYHLSVKAEFGDWELAVPRISAITHRDSNWRTGSRCTDWQGSLQTVQTPIRMPKPEGDGGATLPFSHIHPMVIIRMGTKLICRVMENRRCCVIRTPSNCMRTKEANLLLHRACL